MQVQEGESYRAVLPVCQNCGRLLDGAETPCPGDQYGIHIIASAVEVVPRAVADGLAEALERHLPGWALSDHATLAEFRAVYGPREETP